MKIPISKRLLCCAGFVEPGARVADIGTDHGYLGIYLLKNGIARQVTACDLRPLPLRNAQENAERFGVGAQMEFLLSDGLERVAPDRIDTVVCAGMGGDLIVRILEACAWIRDPVYRLVLQPPDRPCGSGWRKTAMRCSGRRWCRTGAFCIPF